MKRIATFLALLAFLGTFATATYAGPDEVKKAKTASEAISALAASEASAVSVDTWKTFSTNLIHALRMDNDGVRMAAMQYIIRYNDKLDVSVAAVDVARIYRNHDDDNVRRMAVVALSQMNSSWALGYLRLSAHYEKSETVRHTIQAVVAQHEAATGPTAKIGV